MGKNKKRENNIILYIFSFFVLAYIAYAAILLIREPTESFRVERGRLFLEETRVGYIIRNEQVISGDCRENGMQQIKAEGERTARGEAIFRYITKTENDIEDQIAKLDLEIQEVLKEHPTIFSSDIRSLENQIDQKVEVLNQITDATKLAEYRNTILNLVVRQARLAGESSNASPQLRQLTEKRRVLENELNAGAEYIKAPMSGIVSYKVDGLEDILTRENFELLNRQFLEELDIQTGRIIASSDELGKIVDNFTCYIVTISNSEEAREAEVGRWVRVRLSNNEVIRARIVHVAPEEDEENVLLILEIDRQINELIRYRKITFDLIWWSDEGLRIPNGAIFEVDGLNYVLRKRAGHTAKVLVRVRSQNDRYSIISNYTADELLNLGFSQREVNSFRRISLFDEIILNPDWENMND